MAKRVQPACTRISKTINKQIKCSDPHFKNQFQNALQENSIKQCPWIRVWNRIRNRQRHRNRTQPDILSPTLVALR